MSIQFIRNAAALALSGAFLAGCVVAGPGPGPVTPQPVGPTFAEGAWGDAGGVATASLYNGSFVSSANDTGNKVAEGSYQYTGANSIAISYYSLLRNQQIRANCVMSGPSTLNCTNDQGQQFQLYRRSAAA